MIDEVRKNLDAAQFEPFAIVMSGGQKYIVPTRDHAGINPKGTRVLVWFDDGSGITLSGLHICAVEKPVGATGGQG